LWTEWILRDVGYSAGCIVWFSKLGNSPLIRMKTSISVQMRDYSGRFAGTGNIFLRVPSGMAYPVPTGWMQKSLND
jgi:hypothetical protein